MFDTETLCKAKITKIRKQNIQKKNHWLLENDEVQDQLLCFQSEYFCICFSHPALFFTKSVTEKITRILFTFQLKHEIKNVLYFFELWYSSLKTIEGNFGSGVGSFFRYLRTIFLLNFFVSIVSVAFVVVPQILHTNEGNETSQQMHFSWHDLFTGAVSTTN